MYGSFWSGAGLLGVFGGVAGCFGSCAGGVNGTVAARQIRHSDLLELETITSFLLIND